MKRINRRTFLAAAAAAVASPAVAAAQRGGDADVIVVGAGAAGIAAARRLIAAGRKCIVLEASPRIGGRCFTETQTFGVPFDRGAHGIYLSEANPVAKLARTAGLQIYPAPAAKLRVGRRFGGERDLENYLAALVRAKRAIEDAGQEERDVPASRTLPRDLADWRPSIEYALGPFKAAKDLEDLSVQDLGRAVERDIDAYCRQGYGAVLTKLAEGLPIRLSMPVTRIATWRGMAHVESGRGGLLARAVIVTVSTNVLAAGKIRFDPALPKSHVDAAAKLALGSYERVALELEGNPLGLAADDLVFEKTEGKRTGALLANVGGTPLCFVDLSGKFGRGLASQGEAAMVAFAADWLAGLFGSDVKKAVRRTHVTQWAKNPWVLGAFSSAAPQAQAARQTLAEPVRDRIFFAGEATHESLWGTVGGAWEAGERAADAVFKPRGGGQRRRR